MRTRILHPLVIKKSLHLHHILNFFHVSHYYLVKAPKKFIIFILYWYTTLETQWVIVIGMIRQIKHILCPNRSTLLKLETWTSSLIMNRFMMLKVEIWDKHEPVEGVKTGIREKLESCLKDELVHARDFCRKNCFDLFLF
jgi:hypothetical protein